MRTLALLLTALFFALVAPSVAAPPEANGNAGQGNGGGNGNGGANGNGGGNPAATPDAVPAPSPAAPAEPLGQAKKDGEPSGQGNKNSAPPGQLKTPNNPAPPGQAKKSNGGAVSADQDDAQSAVERLGALPLAKIIKIAERRDKGQVINARLLRVSGVLLYQLTLLNDAGYSWRVYYHALRGNPVVLP